MEDLSKVELPRVMIKGDLRTKVEKRLSPVSSTTKSSSNVFHGWLCAKRIKFAHSSSSPAGGRRYRRPSYLNPSYLGERLNIECWMTWLLFLLTRTLQLAPQNEVRVEDIRSASHSPKGEDKMVDTSTQIRAITWFLISFKLGSTVRDSSSS